MPRREFPSGWVPSQLAGIGHTSRIFGKLISHSNVLDTVKRAGAPGAVGVRDAIVQIAVSDLPKSKDWYTRLFGKGPDLEPFPGNVEFKVGGVWVQIVKGKVQASSWSLQLEVGDVSHERERLRTAGIEATEIKTVPDVISYFDIRDDDGNTMRWFQVLTSDPKVTGGRN